MTHLRTFAMPLGLLVAGMLAPGLPLAAQMPADGTYELARPDGDADANESGYAYVSTLDGSAALTAADGGRQALELNQPLAAGDRIRLDRDARVEIVLPEGGVARLTGSSELSFAEVEPMDGGGQNALRLDDGAMQVVVGANGSGDGGAPVRVDTPNATAYFDRDGRYLVETDSASGWTRVVVREGSCELMTERGSRELAAGDEAQVDGADRPRVTVADAGAWTPLELWGGSLDAEAARAASRYVDPSLRYSSTQLAYNGSWASVDGQYAWRPRVDSTWRPYTNGRWASTRSGLTWVSAEPWGWVTSHYGNWDYRPDSGWLWFPGTRYSPAWVYWYWGPTHVGWCPTGYYTRYYGSSYFGSGIRAGIYGWAGGWGGFLDWNFVPVAYVGSRGLNRYCRRGYDLRAELRVDGLPRGIITTDTRGSHRWTRPDDILRDWQGPAGRTRPGRAVEGLPDVSTFISRRRDLDPAVRNQIASVGGEPVLGSGRGRERQTPRPEPWARQRPVERGGDDAGRPRVMPLPAPRDAGDGPARQRVAPLPAPRRDLGYGSGRPSEGGETGDWRRMNPGATRGQERGSSPSSGPTSSDGNAAWRRQGSSREGAGSDRRSPRTPGSDASGTGPRDLRGVEPRQRVPEADPRYQLRVLDRRQQEPAVQDRGPETRSRSVSDERGSYRPSGNDAPPIRRIVEGVRQAPPSSQGSEVRRPEPNRGSERGGDGQARSSRPSRDGDRGRRDSGSRDSQGGGAPPPGR